MARYPKDNEMASKGKKKAKKGQQEPAEADSVEAKNGQQEPTAAASIEAKAASLKAKKAKKRKQEPFDKPKDNEMARKEKKKDKKGQQEPAAADSVEAQKGQQEPAEADRVEAKKGQQEPAAAASVEAKKAKKRKQEPFDNPKDNEIVRKEKKKDKKRQQEPAAADSVEAKKGQQEPAGADSVEAKKGQQEPAAADSVEAKKHLKARKEARKAEAKKRKPEPFDNPKDNEMARKEKKKDKKGQQHPAAADSVEAKKGQQEPATTTSVEAKKHLKARKEERKAEAKKRKPEPFDNPKDNEMARKENKKAKKGQQEPATADSVEAKKGQQEPAEADSVIKKTTIDAKKHLKARKEAKKAKKRQRIRAQAAFLKVWKEARKAEAKKRKQQWYNPPLVTESTRILISKILQEFRDSPDKVYTFEASTSKLDRATIHGLCRKMGMHFRSRGRYGDQRLSVYKGLPKQGLVRKGKDVSTCLRFSDETTKILQDLFSEFPPGDNELSGYAPTNSDTKNVKQPASQNDSFLRPLMSKAEIFSKLESLASKVADTENLRKVSKDRANLPIASFRNDITSATESHQVVLISGETGCGKTTQVPQYILDLMWGKGKTCKIICTQPRRISAISVAERISYERGENVGDTIGYKIRLESKGGRHSSVMFCTNGVLLRILVERGTDRSCGAKKFKDTLSEITHIIMDEIHERDRLSDFMLAILRENLAALPHLRLILMSATMNAQRFSEYFSGCPIIRVPGFTYPVKCLYLDDVLSMLQSAEGNHLDTTSSKGAEEPSILSDEQKTSLDECIEMASSSYEISPLLEMVFTEPLPEIFNYQHSFTGVSPLMVIAGKGGVDEVCLLLSLGADCSLKDNDGNTVLDWAQRAEQADILKIVKKHIKDNQSGQDHLLVDKYLATIDPEHVDIDLIERLLYRISVDSQEGAVLVFLPGWDDINRTREKLLSSPYFLDSSKFVILSLHSMVPSDEQKKVFERVPAGMRKIILSTNIAETAVTIDDVVYVIDSGRMKERNYDPFNNVSTLYASWISKANAKQREGRAGRCQPGICYHLYSKTRAASLPDDQVPEIKRMPIEELCLQVKLLNSDHNIANFLQKTLDPPLLESIDNGIAVLQDIGALASNGNVTKLGEKLGALPVHPCTGKMLLFGILMNCLDPALTTACASDFRDPFLLPMNPEERKRAAAAKVELSSLYGGYSDHLAVIAAFDCWRRAKVKGQDALFCSKYFVSSGTMDMLFGMRKKLQNELVRSGFIPKDASNCNLNAKDLGIVRAVLMAGTYPSVGRMLCQENKKCVLETASGANPGLHSHSSNFKLSFKKDVGGLLFVYDEVTRGEGRLYVKDCSAVGPYPLLLLANEFVVAPASSNAIDKIFFKTSGSDEAEDIRPMSDEKQGDEIMSSPKNKAEDIRPMSDEKQGEEVMSSTKNKAEDIRPMSDEKQGEEIISSLINKAENIRPMSDEKQGEEIMSSPKNKAEDIRPMSDEKQGEEIMSSPKNKAEDIRPMSDEKQGEEIMSSPKNKAEDIRPMSDEKQGEEILSSPKNKVEDIRPMSDEMQGEEIMSSPKNNVSVIVDRWLSFNSTALDAAMIYCLRERLYSAIMFKVEHPKKVLPPVLAASVYAMARTLSYDGMFGISPPLEPVVSAANSAVEKASGQSSSSSASLLSSLFSSSKHVRPHLNANMVQYGNDFAQKAALSGAGPTGSYGGNPSKRHRGSG